jgi:hypothetical protein
VIVPTLIQSKIVDEQGYLTPEWQYLFMQLLQVMQQSLSNEGFTIPPQTTVDIALLTDMVNGTIIYDSTTDNFKGMKGGSLKTFTLV